MKARKWLVLALALVMLTGAFAGCAKKDKEDWDYIKSNGKLKIGITYYEPMNYFDENNKLIGFDTEFAEALCAELGITPEFIEINWDTKETELAAKNIDCIWNGLTVTEERKANMDFTESYIKNMQVCVIKADNAAMYPDVASMADAKLVAEAGSAGESAIMDDETLKNANYTAVSVQSNALMEVKAGTADVAVIDYVMAKSMVGEGTDYSDLMIVDGVELAVEEYAIGLRLGSTETLAKFNEVIDKLIASGKLNEIAEKYGLTDSLLSNQK